MKLDTKPNVISGNMVGQRTAMGVAAEDMSHVMGILAGLYTRQLLAMIREYSTNALDAHVEAGISLPIEVTLPTKLMPNLVIRDFGCGLSSDDINTVYSQYGRSTKRDTNEQVGMMGVGCKSALAYTNQFTVTSVKDGRRVVVLVALDENDAGYTLILEDEPTSEANGTVVTVAIRSEDIQKCHWEAREFFSYWTPGTVLVDGKEPERFEGLKLNDNLYLVKGEPAESRIVMGNVAYPHTIDVGLGKSYNDPKVALVAYVPIGAVRPAPARESLKDVPSTVKTVERVKREYKESVRTVIQREIENAPDHESAIQAYLKWHLYVPDARSQTYTYKGDPLPIVLKSQLPATVDRWGTTNRTRFTLTRNSDYNKKETSFGDVLISDLARTVWVTDYEPEQFTANHKRKLIKWAQDKGIYYSIYQYVLLREPLPDSPFINKKQVVAWETIKAVKLPTERTVYGRIPGSYDVYTESGTQFEVQGSDLRQDKTLLWVRGPFADQTYLNRACKALFGEYTLVPLGANRIAKFTRNATTAQNAHKAIQNAFVVWKTKIDPLDLEAFSMYSAGISGYYKGMDASRVDDPDFKHAIALASRDVSAISKMQDAVRYVISDDIATSKYKHPARNYVLFTRDARMKEHSYLYLNHIYALRQQGHVV